MSTSKNLIIVLILLTVGFLYYHFFIDTLMFSELSGSSQSPMATIFTNLLDFDTNLTRWDIYHLKKKTIEWQRREREIYSIVDPRQRQNEHEKLMAEMMQAPSFKKIERRVLGLGGMGAKNVLEAIMNFKILAF